MLAGLETLNIASSRSHRHCRLNVGGNLCRKRAAIGPDNPLPRDANDSVRLRRRYDGLACAPWYQPRQPTQIVPGVDAIAVAIFPDRLQCVIADHLDALQLRRLTRRQRRLQHRRRAWEAHLLVSAAAFRTRAG